MIILFKYSFFKLIKNIHFGNDEKNIYFRFEINKNSIKMANDNIENQIAIYFADETNSYYSPIRFVNKNENIYPIIKNRFTREVRFVFDNKKVSRLFFNKACSYGLWAQTKLKGSEIAYNGIIEMKISLEDLKLQRNNISFCIIDATNELINEVYPQDVLINLNIDYLSLTSKVISQSSILDACWLCAIVIVFCFMGFESLISFLLYSSKTRVECSNSSCISSF